jgi:hypothetical protein
MPGTKRAKPQQLDRSEPLKWRILVDGEEVESWATEQMARRRFQALSGSMASNGKVVKLIKPDGEED